MPTKRTGERPLPWPPRELARRAVVLIAALAACAPLLLACGPDNENENTIAPIRASLTVNPVPDNPAVFFREHTDPDDPSSADDLVFLDVVLRTPSPLVFDAFTLEVHFDPGLVHVAGGSLSGAFLDTPFGVCNEADNQYCTVKPAQDPICVFSADDPNATGELILGVTANVGNGCPAATANGEVNLLTLGFAAATTGTSSIELIYNSSPMTHGDCEILMAVGGVPTDLGIPCDGNATVSATR